MQALDVRAFLGPSIYCAQQSVRILLAVKEAEVSLDPPVWPRIRRLIMTAFPRLTRPEGLDPVTQALAADLAGTRVLPAGELVGRLALELQRQAGADVTHWRVDESDPARIAVTFSTFCTDTGSVAGKLAAAIVAGALTAALAGDQSPAPPWPYERDLAIFHRIAWPGRERYAMPVILAGAERRGMSWRRDITTANGVLLGQGHNLRRYRGAYSHRTSLIAHWVSMDKFATGRLLLEKGLPVPENRLVRSAEEAVAAGQTIGFPVVVKPNNLGQGLGVEVGLQDAKSVQAAFQRLQRFGRSALVERFIAGEDHRLLVIGERVLAVARRRPARVVGDGVSSVATLVARANQGHLRAMALQRVTVPMKLDEKALNVLAEQGLTPESVPLAGQICFLRRNANVSEGGTAEDVTALTHPDNLAMAVRAARLLGLDVAGVDYLTTAIDRPWHQVGGAICEVNSNPHLGLHAMGRDDISVDIGDRLVELLFPDRSPSEIPVVAITEGPEAPVGRTVKRLLQEAGMRTGHATGEALFVGEAHARATDPKRDDPGLLLSDPELDAAVFSLPLAFLAERGLPFRTCDVALLRSNPGAEAVAVQALGLLRRHTSLCCVVDTDLLPVLEADGPLAPEKTVLLARAPDEERARAHCRAGGEAFLSIEEGDGAAIYRMSGVERERLCTVPSESAETLLAALALTQALRRRSR